MGRRNAKPRNDLEAHERERDLAALALMRREGKSASVAAKEKDTTLKSMKKYVGSALRTDNSGRYQPTPYDRIPRTLNHLLADGSAVPLTIRDSRTASKLGDHSNALRDYRNNRDGGVEGLAQFKGRSFRVNGVTYRFLTDTETIDRLEDAGSLVAIENLYYARMTL